MIIAQIVMFILIGVAAITITPKILWLVFFLFCYRFWEAVLPYHWLSKHISFSSERDYYVTLILLASVVYGLIMVVTRNQMVLQYALLGVMVLYTLKEVSLSDVLFFKDYFEAKGMWSISYWTDEGKKLLSFSIDDFKTVLVECWLKVWHGFLRFVTYLEEII